MSRYGERTRISEAVSALGRKPDAGIGYGVATGGTSSSITVSSQAYTLLTFTASGTLTVTKSGLFDVLAFGGGGGGGGSQTTENRPAGGGGAGAKMLSTIFLDANATITIGAGGAGGLSQLYGAQGGASVVGAALAVIGGGCGQVPFNVQTSSENAIRGGCGGGGSGNTNFTAGALSSYADTNYGQAGGDGVNTSSGGGGGGTGAVGANGASTTGGAGGAGTEINTFIAGSSLFKGGGGGGGGATGGAGGSSIGGAGGSAIAGSSASANTASGGGGGGRTTGTGLAGGAGGSGIIFIRFKV